MISSVLKMEAHQMEDLEGFEELEKEQEIGDQTNLFMVNVVIL